MKVFLKNLRDKFDYYHIDIISFIALISYFSEIISPGRGNSCLIFLLWLIYMKLDRISDQLELTNLELRYKK